MAGTFLLVTGASRGLGRAFSIEIVKKHLISKHVDPCMLPLRVCLLARDVNGLRDTKSQLESLSHNNNDGSVPKVSVQMYPIDLSDISNLHDNLTKIFELENSGSIKFTSAILVNNAGSLGEMCSTSKLTSLSSLQKAVDFNVTSCSWLTSQFASNTVLPATSKIIVNISSLAAVQPINSNAVYCAGKAARDMFHSVLAKENEDIFVINYAPGPCDTDMNKEIRECSTADPSFVDFCIKSKNEGTLVQPHDTAKKLVNLLFCDDVKKIKSGSHVDYYDI